MDGVTLKKTHDAAMVGWMFNYEIEENIIFQQTKNKKLPGILNEETQR